MTDFIAPGMIPSMLLAARRGEYNQGIASADLASLVSAYDAAMGGCPLERRNAEMRALEVLVQSVLKSKAECNHTLMYACVVEEALSPALATLRVGLGADGGTAGGMKITQDQVPEQRQPATTGAPQATPVVLLVHQLVPMPPNFPSKTDYVKQCKLINPKAVVKLNGIPMDVASRVLNPKFL